MNTAKLFVFFMLASNLEIVVGKLAVSAEEQNPDIYRLPAWRKEDYPNPETNPSKCRTTSNRICDPDGVLIDVERHRLAEKIIAQEEKYNVHCDDDDLPMQIVVAIANRMDLIPYGPYEDREEKAVEEFAVYLHNIWGVGVDSRCGGTGVVFFLSILDRSLHVSRGKGLEAILTDKRVDRMIEDIKADLRNEDYAKGIDNFLDEVNKYLNKGPPAKEEKMQDAMETLTFFSFFSIIIAAAIFKAKHEQRESRRYAQVESQLSQLDRDRATALQGRYQCKSCPICLEPFQVDEGEDRATKGSDGQPLKLLRCGHVFDETCWSEWVTSGSGNVRRCPICQQDIGISGNEEIAPLVENVAAEQPDNQDRVFRQFNRERNFRLLRLGLRFPQYVGQTQIQRWTSSTYEGELVRDPSFTRSNPRFRTRGTGGRSFESSGFGGGSSGGGRGGRW